MKNSIKLTVALLGCVALLAAFGAAAAMAEFGLSSYSSSYQQPLAEPPPSPDLGTSHGTKPPLTQAGAHPDIVTDFTFNTTTGPEGGTIPDQSLKNVQADLPAGFYGNPEALPSCRLSYMFDHEGFCKPAAQVGELFIGSTFGGGVDVPIYNMEVPDDQTAVFAAQAFGSLIKYQVTVRTEGDFGLQILVENINQAFGLFRLKTTIWGLPADKNNDPWRGYSTLGGEYPHPSAGIPVEPYLTAPARCDAPLTTEIHVDSWQHPGRRNADRTADLSDPNWKTTTQVSPPLEGCDALDFSATMTARPTTTAADSPSGLDFDLGIPQNFDPEGLSTAQLRTSVVTLPEGFVVNPSSANGLEACSPAQIGLNTPVGDPHPRFDKLPVQCPDASRIGTVEVDTPVFADPLKGAIYVATPDQNPFGNLLTLYAVFSGRGLIFKLAGKVTPDPKTGQLTTVFDETPQQTFEHFKFKFFGGAFAPLRTPAACGTYSTTGTMTPWSAPDTGPPTAVKDTYAITQAPGGKACATSKASLPNTPAFEAGSAAALAGQYKPFTVNLRRNDATQEFGAVTLTPPPGLVAKLANTAICSDADLAAAAAKTGAQERARASCPAASEIGSAFAAAGAGPAPYNAPGKVYLAGPYKGAPLSMVIVTPAVAGPYDLGTIVVRAALYLNQVTAEITAKSDPIPQILQGIPLDVRSVSVRLDKPDFTLNPTSCDPMKVSGTLLSATGGTAALENRFQLAECGRLKFKPSLKLSLKGGTKRGDYPALTAVLKNRSGDANISSAQVKLPHSAFLAQEHIKTICTRVQWAADACPPGSVYGSVSVVTPLLGYPLTGKVYLRASSNPLPDLVPDLRGPAYQPIRFESAGKTDSVDEALRNTFSFVPDVPFSKLVLKLDGGKKGLLVNSTNICARTNRAAVKYTAHNGLSYSVTPAVKPAGCKKKAGKGKTRKGKRGGKR